MEGFLRLKVSPWVRLFITRSLAIVPAVVVAILAQGQLDQLDQGINVLQSVQLPFAMLPLILFVSDYNLMKEFAMQKVQSIFTWVLFLFILAINIYLTQQYFLLSL